jgi:multiple sugar transport system permease protein
MWSDILWHLAAALLAVIFVVPLYWLMTASLRTLGAPLPRTLEWLPSPLMWSNYQKIFEIAPLGRQIGNSLWVSLAAIPITVLAASWAGFAIVQLPDRLRKSLVILAILLLMTPNTALWLPRYVLFSWAGLLDHLAALVAPAIMGTKSLYVLLYFWTFRRLPNELFESARLDGAGAWQIWGKIALPLARPTTFAVALLSFSHYWSDFVDPFLYLKSAQNYTLAVGLRQLQAMDTIYWPLLMAATALMVGPVLVIYLFLHNFSHTEGRLTGIIR